ncbi:protein translocase subunit secF /protein translocase subunit secD [Leeuwenhoekiella aestuarii]|uniref:Multifunctional fusion protein n=1 Tax=Leeuwenhoekiella aestuarii TaxID=2249426 RepID=A0A4Q0NQC9_9FLAO|nr:protein translocase subunit SecDF [Leeuwenhoekiella aestuarii]RXG12556.1 protein translocase subunit secF /protein translocase subunit secD [Leeuwenhoekiella aestuarii]RXG14503.1 protein translocase subunit secF /protein translocase subunit secD [Leeuwenhoekiella aestuarii]
MQNKGLIRVFAILFGLVSLYQLSFTYFTNQTEDKAAAFAEQKVPNSVEDYVDRRGEVERQYLDSIGNDPIALGITYNDAKDKELNKGLDLKGGMNAILEISVADILRGLSNNSTDPAFNQAIDQAAEAQKDSQNSFLDDFFDAFEAIPGDNKLASPDIFANTTLGEKINFNMTNAEVEPIIAQEIEGSINSAFEVLRNRIDKFGVTQPNIQRLDNQSRILIELPGATDIERVKFQLESTAQLEFYKTHYASQVAPYLLEVNTVLKDIVAPAEEQETTATVDSTDTDDSIEDLLASEEDSISPAAQNNPLFEVFSFNPAIQQYAQAPIVGYAQVKDTATINGYLGKPEIVRLRPQELRFAKFRWGITEGESDVVPLYALMSDRSGSAAMDGDVVQDSRQQYTQAGQPSVGIDFEGQGPGQWAKLTGEVASEGNAIAIVLDGTVYSAATAKAEIKNGATEISGSFTVAEAQDLANVLKAGKLPASAKIISYDVVGPSLGQEAINSGLMSFVIALLLVLVWMVFYYGKAGLFADVALAVNILFIFGILAGLGAVLTLPGIAGIVLTIGMSVDANVLIFERIKEEIAKGKSQKDAIKDGFNNALSSILDANITTFLTALILFLFGTGPIQGFATTLMIGIGTSLFTAIFVTRLFIDGYGKNGKSLAFSTGATKNLFTNFNRDFLAKRKVAYIISGVLIIISLISLFTNSLDQGVDFVGGRNYTVRFEAPVNATEVENKLIAELESAQAKTYGEANQLKITTKYRIDEEASEVDDDIQQKLYAALKSYLPADLTLAQFVKGGSTEEKVGILEYNKVGPTIADDIKRDSFWAVLGSLVVVFLYILLRFRRWQFSLGAVVAVFHDVLIVLGIFSLTYKFMPFNMEIDQSFIAAILTVIGYSLNDTVVVFDRIREFMKEYGTDRKMGVIINQAINSTISRTLNTSMTTLIVLLAIFIFGGASIMGFMFALIVGVVVGTYSSIFIATPVMFDTIQKKALKPEKVEEEETVA